MECWICEETKKSLYGRHCSVAELRKSRRKGCWLCSTVLDAVDIFRPSWTSDHFTDGTISCNRRPGTDGTQIYVDLHVLDDWKKINSPYINTKVCIIVYTGNK